MYVNANISKLKALISMKEVYVVQVNDLGKFWN